MARRGISGLFLSGTLMAFLGSILLAWRHHIDPNYLHIGTLFLLQNLGMLVAPVLAAPLLRKRGIRFVMTLACVLACCAMLLLAAFSPPSPFYWQLIGLFLVGLGAGLLNTSVFHAISSVYHLNPAATLTLAGALYGLGAMTCALFVAGTFFVYNVASVLILLALLPAFAAVVYYRAKLPDEPIVQQVTWTRALQDFRSPAAILFALLLFFQSGSEGALAGWLALFLTQRLGASPVTSLFLLALYWFALLTGRVAAQWLLPRVRHARLLALATLAPMFACVVLFSTNNLFGATVGVLLAGGGFSVILPLVVEKIGDRFPYFHPGFFSGIFSIASTGSLLAPASLGYLAHFYGVGVVMGLPLAGSIMVVFLIILIMLEARLSSPRKA
ncbi:MFS transporter [uncultured Paludibaculum sp.]|uniref:MFS transporter n=1 Tax=uncultured Paludibaculum sp. TaxID=1765020 RepID=UPI002AABF884|nr:MFS transporter [uncultured Paludibaculum sp.]